MKYMWFVVKRLTLLYKIYTCKEIWKAKLIDWLPIINNVCCWLIVIPRFLFLHNWFPRCWHFWLEQNVCWWTTNFQGYKQRLLTTKSITQRDMSEWWYILTSGFDNIMRPYNLVGELVKSITIKSGKWPSMGHAVTMGWDLVYTSYDARTLNFLKNMEIQKIIRLRGCIHQITRCTFFGDPNCHELWRW